MTTTRRLAAILAADVAGYSRLMGADEEGTLERLKALHRALFDPKIAEGRHEPAPSWRFRHLSRARAGVLGLAGRRYGRLLTCNAAFTREISLARATLPTVEWLTPVFSHHLFLCRVRSVSIIFARRSSGRTGFEPSVPLLKRQRRLGGFGTDSPQTPCWREMDSNHRYLEDKLPLRDGLSSHT
jgi:hypothetical protein